MTWYSMALENKIPFFNFWLEKSKSNSTIKRKILITCTSGTKDHPILIYLLRTLIARFRVGDKLHPSQPVFGVPIQKHKSKKGVFLPLSYSDIEKADEIRTAKLGYKDICFRSHLRRRGGASDLFDAGVAIKDIKVVGHWSMGVLDPYLSWSSEEISALQLAGILRAETRLEKNWASKIVVLFLVISS